MLRQETCQRATSWTSADDEVICEHFDALVTVSNSVDAVSLCHGVLLIVLVQAFYVEEGVVNNLQNLQPPTFWIWLFFAFIFLAPVQQRIRVPSVVAPLSLYPSYPVRWEGNRGFHNPMVWQFGARKNSELLGPAVVPVLRTVTT